VASAPSSDAARALVAIARAVGGVLIG
jgi:hypothetical protein